VVVAYTPDFSHESRPSRSIVTDVIVTVENRTSPPSLIYLQFGDRSDSLERCPAVPPETADFEFTPDQPGDLLLVVGPANRAQEATVRLRVSRPR
jgi:hypothetical protein